VGAVIGLRGVAAVTMPRAVSVAVVALYGVEVAVAVSALHIVVVAVVTPYVVLRPRSSRRVVLRSWWPSSRRVVPQKLTEARNQASVAFKLRLEGVAWIERGKRKRMTSRMA
jgi:hypothetical protein